jgi:hypothetical protein
MDLGDVNLAEKMAFELLENKGSSPETLERLATTSLAKGHTETAKVFLNALEKHLVHGRHARNLLQRLDSESEFCSPEAEVLRSMMIAGTGAVFPVGEPAFLLQLLEHNGGNKMAFEYLMAFALLTRRPDKVAENIRRLPELGYSEIPRLYEEAVLIYQVGTRTNVDLHGMQIAESTRQDFARYLEMARTHGRDTAGLKRAMAPDFGNSFLYYMHFFESGVGR